MDQGTMHPGEDYRRQRGRPSLVDRVSIGQVAIRLWNDQGFSRTTWDDISRESGVSQRTLLRHFSTKEDLAWVAVPLATYRLQSFLVRADADLPTQTAITQSVLHSLQTLDDYRESSAEWLHLLSVEPALRNSAATAYQPWTNAIADFVHTRHPAMPAPVSHGIASAFQVTTFEALLLWSHAPDDTSPQAAVQAALEWLIFSHHHQDHR